MNLDPKDTKNQVTSLAQAIQIANPTDAMQKRSSYWMPYQRDMLLKAEAAARFALDQLEQVKKEADDLQQKCIGQEQELFAAQRELECLTLRNQLSECQNEKKQLDQDNKKLARQLSGQPRPHGWRTTQAMQALAKRSQSARDSTTPEAEAPFDIRKAMAIQKARAARETANQEKDIDHQKPSSPITIEETGNERDLLGRLPHPSLQGGDCFC